MVKEEVGQPLKVDQVLKRELIMVLQKIGM